MGNPPSQKLCLASNITSLVAWFYGTNGLCALINFSLRYEIIITKRTNSLILGGKPPNSQAKKGLELHSSRRINVKCHNEAAAASKA